MTAMHPISRHLLLRRGGLLAFLALSAASMSMVVPILATSFSNPQHAVMLAGLPVGVRNAAYGVVVGVFPITSFILAPLLGTLSDSLGRKRLLFLGAIGLSLSNLAVGAGIHLGLLPLLFAGRIAGGIAAGTTAVAEAAFVDTAPVERRHAFLGYALLCWGIGYAIGPAFAAAAAQWHLPGGMPLLLLTVSLFSLLLLPALAALPHDGLRPGTGSIAQHPFCRAMADLAGIFSNQKLAAPAWSMLLSRMGTGAYGAFIPIFLIHRLSFGSEDIAWFLSLFGIGSGIAFFFIYPFVSARFAVRSITTLSLWGTLAAIALSLAYPEKHLAWIFPLPISIFLSLAYGGFMGIMADTAGEERRGWIFGIANSLDSLALGLGVLLCGFFEAKSENSSMLVALALFLAAPLVFARHPRAAAQPAPQPRSIP